MKNTGLTISLLILLLITSIFGIISLAHKSKIDSIVETTCVITSKELNPYICCSKTCSTCTQCSFDSPTCSSLLSSKTEGKCCNGYKCCNEICDRCCDTCCDNCCTRVCDRCCSQVCDRCCSQGRCWSCNCRQSCRDCNCRNTNCVPCRCRECNCRNCNCQCIQSVSNLECQVNCGYCYNPSVIGNYTYGLVEELPEIGYYEYKYEKSCRQGIQCAEEFLDAYPNVNEPYTCWYDPENKGEPYLSNEYKYGLFITFYIFLGLSILNCLIIWIINIGENNKSKPPKTISEQPRINSEQPSYKEIETKYEEKNNIAAKKIQNKYREYKTRQSAAIKIQSTYRGHIVRRNMEYSNYNTDVVHTNTINSGIVHTETKYSGTTHYLD